VEILVHVRVTAWPDLIVHVLFVSLEKQPILYGTRGHVENPEIEKKFRNFTAKKEFDSVGFFWVGRVWANKLYTKIWM
jgi:hypothetical protein